MSLVMNIGAADDLVSKALRAVHDADRAGRVPMKWIMGRETYCRVAKNVDPRVEFKTLVGLPFEVKNDVPPTLLELDVF